MKGLATETIVLLILALIVLGILGGLIFIGGGPFRTAAEYNACKGRLTQWCITGQDDVNAYIKSMGGTDASNLGNCITVDWTKYGYKGDLFPDTCTKAVCCNEVT